MKHISYKLMLIASVFFLHCADQENDEIAHTFEKDGLTHVKLFGKRIRIAHDLQSASNPHTYIDSIIFPLSNASGQTKGEDIPVQKGYYKYAGEILIDGNYATVNLQFNNTDSNKLIPSPWNGRYKIVPSQ